MPDYSPVQDSCHFVDYGHTITQPLLRIDDAYFSLIYYMQVDWIGRGRVE